MSFKRRIFTELLMLDLAHNECRILGEIEQLCTEGDYEEK